MNKALFWNIERPRIGNRIRSRWHHMLRISQPVRHLGVSFVFCFSTAMMWYSWKSPKGLCQLYLRLLSRSDLKDLIRSAQQAVVGIEAKTVGISMQAWQQMPLLASIATACRWSWALATAIEGGSELKDPETLLGTLGFDKQKALYHVVRPFST